LFWAVYRKKGKDITPPLSLLPVSSGFCLNDFFPLVKAAIAANLMGDSVLAAVGALDQSGSSQLPDRGASFIASRFGNFSLGYCHVSTSSIFSDATVTTVVLRWKNCRL
jgi:hypothetical protein